MNVIATKIGYYQKRRLRVGQAFKLTSKEEFSKSWMKEAKAPEAPKKKEVETKEVKKKVAKKKESSNEKAVI